jgi:hypothetical protein
MSHHAQFPSGLATSCRTEIFSFGPHFLASDVNSLVILQHKKYVNFPSIAPAPGKNLDVALAPVTPALATDLQYLTVYCIASKNY